MILHTHEPCPAVFLRARLHHRKLVRPHTAGPDVAHFPGPHEIVKRLHGFFNGRFIVEAVDLEEIDVISFQPSQRTVDGA